MVCIQTQFLLNFSKTEAFPTHCNIIIFSRYLSPCNHIISFFPDLLLHCFSSAYSTLQVGVIYGFNKHILATKTFFFDSEILITFPYYSFFNSFLSNYNNFFCWSQNMTPTACSLPTRPVILHEMNIKLVWHILFLVNVCLPSLISFIFIGAYRYFEWLLQYFSSNWSKVC